LEEIVTVSVIFLFLHSKTVCTRWEDEEEERRRKKRRTNNKKKGLPITQEDREYSESKEKGRTAPSFG